jgi:hypothetical protein
MRSKLWGLAAVLILAANAPADIISFTGDLRADATLLPPGGSPFRVDPGYSLPIAGHWAGIWSDGIDAGLVWPNGKAYFFKGPKYIRYDIATDQADPGFPKDIQGNWPGFPTTFAAGIDNAVVWNNGKAYFFKGKEYIRYDIGTDKTDVG